MVVALLNAFGAGVPAPVSAECSGDLDDRCTHPSPTKQGALDTFDCEGLEPDGPENGTGGATSWFVGQNMYLACGFVDSVEDSILLHGGNVTWKLGVVATGGADLFNTDVLAPAVVVYQSNATDAAQSQAHDSCAAMVGSDNPVCGTDRDVGQSLECPGGLEIPNPVGGGLVGDSLDNSNGLLQATCVLVGAWSAAAPNAAHIMEYGDDVQLMLIQVNDEVLAFASDASDAVCIYLTGEAPCV